MTPEEKARKVYGKHCDIINGTAYEHQALVDSIAQALREARAEGMREAIKELEAERNRRGCASDIQIFNRCIGIINRLSGEDSKV